MSLAQLPTLYALRALSDRGENFIGGLLVAFTGPQKKDRLGQWFTKDTNFGEAIKPGIPVIDRINYPLSYHHGKPLRGKALLGMVGKLSSVEWRDDGLYGVSELNMEHPSYPFIQSQAEKGELGYSVETMPHYFAYRADGFVTDFPILGAAVSPYPTAPERLTTVGALRAIGLEFDGDEDSEVGMTARSVWYFDWEEKPAPTPAPIQRTSVTYDQAMYLRGQSGGAASPRLPSSGFNPVETLKVTEMKAPLDQVSLVNALGWYVLGQAATSGKHMKPRYPDGMTQEQFMRGLFERVVKEYQVEDNLYLRGEQIVLDSDNIIRLPSDWDILSRHFSKMSGKPYETPYHLRANELMQETLNDYGDEWVFDAWSLEVWRNIRMMAKVFPLFPAFNMTSNPFNYPVVGNLGYARRVAEATAQSQLSLTATTYPTRKLSTDGTVVFNIPAKFGLLTPWSDELRKWSQIDVLAEVMFAYMEMFAHTADRAILRGDETDTNVNISWYDAAGTTPTANGTNDYLLNLDGLVHKCVVDATGQSTDKANAAFALADVNINSAKMGILSLQVEDLVLICDTSLAHKFRALSEVLTVDKYGPEATVHTGEIGKIMGIPIIPSEDMGLTLGTSGRIDQTAANNTQLNFMIVNRKTVKIGRGWDIQLEHLRAEYSDAEYVKGRMSFDMQLMQANGVSYTYDIAP